MTTSSFLVKVKRVYVPLLLMQLGLLVGYTFLHWIILLKLELFEVTDFWITFITPFCIASLLVLVWLGPRMRLLHLKRQSGDLPTFYRVVAVVAIALPTVIAQHYLQTATGILTELPNIYHLEKAPKTKYYSLANYRIDQKNIGIFQETTTSGKRNSNLVFTFYITCPILLNLSDTGQAQSNPDTKPLYFVDGTPLPPHAQEATSTPASAPASLLQHLRPDDIASIEVLKDSTAQALYGTQARKGVVHITTKVKAWLGKKYSRTISNKLEKHEKEKLFNEFARKTEEKFQQEDFNKIVYLERVRTSDDLEAYEISRQKAPNYNSDHTSVILFGHTTPFSERNGKKLAWTVGSLLVGSLIWFFMVYAVPLAQVKKRKRKTPAESWKETWSWLLPSEGFTITPFLVYANVFAFLAMAIAGYGFINFKAADLLSLGANYGPLVIQGEVWRLLTGTFLHGGIMHLFMNMYGLFFIGAFLEPILGKFRYLLTYLLCGLTASLASIWWYKAQISVGASGAVFGLFGFFLALLTTKAFPPDFRKSFLVSIGFFVGYNLLVGLADNQIDNAAHIGGLLTGIGIGYLYYFLKRKEWQEEQPEEELLEQETLK